MARPGCVGDETNGWLAQGDRDPIDVLGPPFPGQAAHPQDMPALRLRLDLEGCLSIRERIEAIDRLAGRIDQRDVEIGGRPQRAALDVCRQPLSRGQVEGERVAIAGRRDRAVQDPRDRGRRGLLGRVVGLLLQGVRIGGDLEGNPGGGLVARPPQLLEEALGRRRLRDRDPLGETIGPGNAQRQGVSRPDRQREGHPTLRESADSQHIGQMVRPSETRVADLDRVPPGLLERVCKPAVEDQADIVVTLGDPMAPRRP